MDRSPVIFGRHRELEWLFDRISRRVAPIVICGRSGSGKTTLLMLASTRMQLPVSGWNLSTHPNGAMVEVTARIEELSREKHPPEVIAIDDADALTERDMNEIADRLLNLKAIRTVIFARQWRPDIPRSNILELGPLSNIDSEEMLKILGSGDLPDDEVAKAVATADGFPLALSVISELLRGRDSKEIGRLLKGEVYDLKQDFILPKKELISKIKPRIMLANEALIVRLRRQPQSVYQLPPRKFEELVAELLAGLGYEVELTPASRDGGKDILAYMATPHGRVLCLVEAKRYRQDRAVGVELVRQLYGTLIDADASSAMLVTTSSFSAGAKEFQQKHQYKLALRDYGNVVQWIQNHK